MKSKIFVAIAATAFIATSAMATTKPAGSDELAWGYQQKQKGQNGGGSNSSSSTDSSIAWGYQQKQKGQNGGGNSSTGA